jgi:hypothetical protein
MLRAMQHETPGIIAKMQRGAINRHNRHNCSPLLPTDVEGNEFPASSTSLKPISDYQIFTKKIWRLSRKQNQSRQNVAKIKKQ